MQNKSQERWTINKIGLINFWWYDEEEFRFEGGRMILRGKNGSGKSVTMQSFIPLLLDAKKTPERLDPFGNKARRIEDYVLGYGDAVKEENTSYLYMEFYKESTQSYISVGMGLHGKKGQSVKFWGFLLKDGRRIGEDFFLYKDPSNKIPLTKMELKNRIGQGGEIVETQKDYANMVNNAIFGFETLEEYDEFIKLLIEIRTPKLSDGKNFKPSTVLEILNNSLRPLSDEDLRPVSDSIDNMNKTKDQLHFLKLSEKAIQKIKEVYQKYNQYLLYIKAKKYQEFSKNYQNKITEIQDLERLIEEQQKKWRLSNEQRIELEAKQKANALKEEELRNSEGWQTQEKLETVKKELEETKEKIASKQKKIEEQENAIRKQKDKYKKYQSEYEKTMKEFLVLEEEMNAQAKEIGYENETFRMSEVKEKMHEEYSFEPVFQELERYMQKIKNGLEALKNLNTVAREYDKLYEELEYIKNQKNEQDQKVTNKRKERDEQRSQTVDNMYAWNLDNKILQLDDLEKTVVVQKIENYGDSATWDDIMQAARIPYHRIENRILKEKLQLDKEREDIEQQIFDRKQEKTEWQNQKDPEPEREDNIIKNRESLKKANIPFLPFYQTVEFKKDIDEKTKGVIESALKDMGILDALIIPENKMNLAFHMDCDFVDKYLLANPIEFRHDLTEILEVSLPEDSEILPLQVVNTLKTIMLDDKSSQNYLDENGYYKIGLIKGRTTLTEEAKFIGQEARRKYRQMKILMLEEEIQILEKEKQEKAKIIEEQERKLEYLKEEFENFPKEEVLKKKEEELRKSILHLESMKSNIEQKSQVVHKKQLELTQANIEVKERTMGISLLLKLETYEEANQTAQEFKENWLELKRVQNSLKNYYNTQKVIEDNIESSEIQLEDLRYEENELSKTEKQKEEARKTFEELLEKSGNQMQEEMTECLRLKESLPKEIAELIDKNGKLIENTNQKKERLDELKQEKQKLEVKKKIAEEIYLQEWNLGYLFAENQELKASETESKETELDIQKNAKQIAVKYAYFDKQNKNQEEYGIDLANRFRENQEYLVDYNLSLQDIFIEEIQEEDSELITLLQTRTRKDITCFVKGRKVDFLTLEKEITENIKETQSLIEEDDRRLFEEILTNTVGRKIRESIYHAKEWVKGMNQLMENIQTSSQLSFSLNWRPKVANDENEMDTKELVEILNIDGRVLRKEDIEKVANHFRTRFVKAESKMKGSENIMSFHDIIKETLDYRSWFEFQFNYKKGIETKKELTNNAFFKLSGGEKAMAMYIPLFAAVTSKFQSAKTMAPRIISLDEAFAGVDDNNIRDMIRILTEMELEYIINSQVLWGEYDTIPSLAIYELVSIPELKLVTIVRYVWNGKRRILSI